ncbi:hypothetical protein TNIN_77121 [Trichonephila inaurata madagascariensis]|uniref:Uncharacterized protein n=1 Tax=Trichonephila inaurata madagascariensis TaxID=2747483 RepID=A0A8X6Y757_9ARAC|nr:hypothetical protein TNIN_77121 [Trichonephila inaurata madagascariensis]
MSGIKSHALQNIVFQQISNRKFEVAYINTFPQRAKEERTRENVKKQKKFTLKLVIKIKVNPYGRHKRSAPFQKDSRNVPYLPPSAFPSAIFEKAITKDTADKRPRDNFFKPWVRGMIFNFLPILCERNEEEHVLPPQFLTKGWFSKSF